MSELIMESAAGDGVALLTLNRPRARNALSRSLRDALLAELSRLQDDPNVGAIILTGTDPAFCSGMDTKELEREPESIHTIGPRYRPLFESRKPVIGAINGAAMTGGLELALACDWLIASDSAVFADSHTRLGLTPGWGLTVLLAEAVGVRRARQLIASGMVLDAATALTWGLVNEVVAHADLLRRAREIGRAVVANDADAVARVLETFSQQRSFADSAAWAIEARHWVEGSGVRSTQSHPDES